MRRTSPKFTKIGKALCTYCHKTATANLIEGYSYSIDDTNIVTAVTPRRVYLCDDHRREKLTSAGPRYQVGDRFFSLRERMKQRPTYFDGPENPVPFKAAHAPHDSTTHGHLCSCPHCEPAEPDDLA